MTDKLDRRDFLRLSAAGGSIAGLTCALGNLGFADDLAAPNRKLLVIFLRGGNDGLNALVPSGPQAVTNGVYGTYSTQLRPAIHIYNAASARPGAALPLLDPITSQPHPFAELNPAMATLQPIYQAGSLAYLHRIGSQGMSRSHFADQRFWETLRPQPPTTTTRNYAATNYHEGWVAKWASQQTSGFSAASLSVRQQQLCDSIAPGELQAHIRKLYEAPGVLSYSFDGPGLRGTQTGTGLDSIAAHLRTGLAARADTTAYPGRTPADERVRDTLDQTVTSEAQATSSIGAYTPFGNPVYPVRGTAPPAVPTDLPESGSVDEFGARMQDAARLIKNSSARIVCVELGGFDNHAEQVYAGTADHELGNHQEMLATLATGMAAIYQDVNLDPLAPELLTLVVSEFGRTSDQNNSRGTDHASGGLMLAMGDRIRTSKVVHNFEHNPASWQHMTSTDFTSAGPRHMAHKTDFRTVFEEVFQKYLLLNSTQIAALLPGFAADKTTLQGIFGHMNYTTQLNFLV